MHPRRHLPQGDGKRKDVGLERHADILRIRHFATAHATARDPAGTWSCSGDMNAGVPLKPVFATVSIRFSFRATPTERTRLKDPFPHSTSFRPSFRTEVADADFQVAVQLFEQNVERLDVAVNDLSSHIANVQARSPNSEAAAAAALHIHSQAERASS